MFARAAFKGLLIVIGAVVALGIVSFLLSSWAPSWWIEPAALVADPDNDRRGRELEQNLAAEISKVRPPGEAWAIRIHDRDINAWIATRLPAWTAHDSTLAWPIPGSAVQVRFEPGGIVVGIGMQGRVWSGAFAPTVEPGMIRITPGGGAVGRVPIPEGAAMVAQLMEGDAAKSLSLPREFALGDGRTLEVRRVEAVEGSIEIEFLTR